MKFHGDLCNSSRLKMFNRLRQRLFEHQPEIEHYWDAITSVLIPSYTLAVPTYVTLLGGANFDRQFGPHWFLAIPRAKGWVGRLLSSTPNVIRREYLVPTLIVLPSFPDEVSKGN